MRLLLPSAQGIVAVSQAVADDMRRELRFENVPITVIHNPIVTPDFDARMREAVAWPWDDRDLPTIIFVGRLVAEKRLDLLFDSFIAMNRHTPARLLIVGTGAEQKEVERRIQEEHLQKYCRLIGYTHNVLPLIRAADVLVLPSDYEGFGNVLVEAMACGTQVVSTNCPHGPAEILDEGKFGQLVPMNDPTALAVALRNSLNHCFLIRPEDLKARASSFSVEAAVNHYMAIVRPASQ